MDSPHRVTAADRLVIHAIPSNGQSRILFDGHVMDKPYREIPTDKGCFRILLACVLLAIILTLLGIVLARWSCGW